MKTPQTLPLAILFLLFSYTVFGQNQKYITTYSGDFSGLKYEYGVGQYDNQYMALSSTSHIKSIRIPEGMKVTLYSENNFKGERLVLTKDIREAELKAKGFTSITLSISMIVEENRELPADSKIPSIVIYKDNFSGTNKRFSTGRFDMNELGDVGNDHVSSVKVSNGLKVTLFENQNFTGRSLVLTKDASADYLKSNNFNDLTTSLIVEEIPQEIVAPPVVVVQQPKTPAPEEKPEPIKEVVEAISPGVTIYQDDFRGERQTLPVGTHPYYAITIGNNEVSSVRVTEGYRAILYDQADFNGRSLMLSEQDANTAFLESKQFNDVVSAIVVELIPQITLFESAFEGKSKKLLVGHYATGELGIANDQLSSLRIPEGMWALIFEHDNFTGKSLLLQKDTDPTYLRNRGFDNIMSSLVVGSGEPLPQVTIYQKDFTGPSQKLTPGRYEHPDLEIGNNAISSVSIPKGLKVTLYENSDFTGRYMKIYKNASEDLMNWHKFNKITSSLVVEWVDPELMQVSIYSDRFSGVEQVLGPGKYEAKDLKLESKTISSLKVPPGMRITLYEQDNFKGTRYLIDRNMDLSYHTTFNDFATSLIVEDPFPADVSPAPETTEPPKVEPAKDTIAKVKEEPIIEKEPDCTFTNEEYEGAVYMIKSKMFSKEKLDVALIATKDKCLSHEQIRGIAGLFDFEENTLEFVMNAYGRAKDKSTYYKLDDLFRFMSSKDAFLKFLQNR